MVNRDWEKFGEDIRRTVQEAVNSQNFDKLNQTVTETINDAAAGIAEALKQAGKSAAEAGRRTGGAGNMKGYGYREPVYREPVYREPRMPAGAQKREVCLYRKTGSAKAGGTILTAVGMGIGCVSVFSLLFFITGALIGGGIGRFGLLTAILSLSGSLVGFSMFGWGAAIRKRMKRFQAYVEILGGREYCNIRELAERTGKSVKYVTKDLEKLLSEGWFLQGHMDEKRTCLMVSNGMYEKYLELQAERRSMEAEAVLAETEEREKQKQRKQKKKQSEQKKREFSRRLPPEAREIIEEGEAYIQKISSCRESLSGKEISEKISRMETVVEQIFDKVERNPEFVDDIRRLMDYYLPTTVKLLEAYRELDAQPVEGENIRSSKREIEKTLDTLNTAFEKLLDNLFQDTAWDVSSDISVLHTMLAQEGLTEEELRR